MVTLLNQRWLGYYGGDALRLHREQEHNRRIEKKAEVVWGEATLAGKKRITRRSSLIVKWGGIARGMRVLEIGCGTGEYTLGLARTGAAVFATDISEGLLSRAADKVQGTDCGLRIANCELRIANCESRIAECELRKTTFILCQAEHLPFRDNSFDAVVGNAVLHHLDLPLALQEIKRVLTLKGRFAFTEPNMLNPQNMLIKNIKPLGRLLGESPDETAFFSWRILRQLRGAGFCELQVIPFDFLHPIVPDSLTGVVSLLGELLEKIYGVRNMAGSLLIAGGKTDATRIWEM